MSRRWYLYFAVLSVVFLAVGLYFNQPVNLTSDFVIGLGLAITGLLSIFAAMKFYNRYLDTTRTRLLYVTLAFLSISIFYETSALIGYFHDFVPEIGPWLSIYHIGNLVAAIFFIFGYFRNYLTKESAKYAGEIFLFFVVFVASIIAIVIFDPDIIPSSYVNGNFTTFRDAMVYAGTILYGIAFILYIKAAYKTENVNSYYFVYGVLLLLISQLALILQQRVGDLLSWMGELSGFLAIAVFYYYIVVIPQSVRPVHHRAVSAKSVPKKKKPKPKKKRKARPPRQTIIERI